MIIYSKIWSNFDRITGETTIRGMLSFSWERPAQIKTSGWDDKKEWKIQGSYTMPNSEPPTPCP